METRPSPPEGPGGVAESLAWPGHPAAGWNHRCLVTAEIGNIHDGSLGNCHALMDACAGAGVDAVKMQCHVADAESTPNEKFPVRFAFHPQDAARTDYWRRMEFTRRQWVELADHAIGLGVEFIVSPFSLAGLERIADLCAWIKVASGEANHWRLLAEIGQTGKPVVLSTGMTPERDWVRTEDGRLANLSTSSNDIDVAVCHYLRPKRREDCIVLQCTTAYPTPLKQVGLNKVYEYSRQQNFLGGLSDHSGLIWPGVAAAVLGAHMIEVHVCWSTKQFGADASSSLNINELRRLVAGVRAVESMRRNPVDKTAILETLDDVAVYREGKTR